MNPEPTPPTLPAVTTAQPPMPPAPGGFGAVTPDDRTMGMLCHLLAIFTGFLGPLVLWLVKKDQSRFVDHHGREALNFQITVFIVTFSLSMVAGVLMLVFVGIFLIPVIFAYVIFALIVEIMAALAAQRGELHRYPFCLRLF